jgi:hypothetical protein
MVQDVQIKKRRESGSQVEEIEGGVVRARSVTVGSVTGSRLEICPSGLRHELAMLSSLLAVSPPMAALALGNGL